MRISNPFSKLENPKAVWAWGMYDLANQSFQLLINTLLLSIYLNKVVVGDPDKGRTIWGVMIFVANGVVVLLSPILGALADARFWKKQFLIGTGIACTALIACLPMLGPGDIALAVILYVPAAIACGLGENFLASFLPTLARREQIGRVSAIGWTMSYIGALGLLLIAGLAVMKFNLVEAREWKVLFYLAAAWFGIGILPAMFMLHEQAITSTGDGKTGNVVVESLLRLRRSIRRTQHFRQLGRFFIAFFVYSMGTQTVVFFAGLIGDSFGFGIGDLIYMALVMALTAGVGSTLAGIYQDRLGHRRTVQIVLSVWVVSTLCLGLMQALSPPKWWFWLISGGIGLGLGGIGTASRAMVGAFTPRQQSAEFFGIWGMAYKLASIGGLAFGVLSQKIPYNLFIIAGFFVLGWILLRRVNEEEGLRIAEQSEVSELSKR